ncbi:hypothetical protein [Streptomyces gardneri]|uniref:Uncharacterized protein n=1 Tax=Streptomyces gardneri TaxID=66892 RepID=A0A4Y3RW06_9ACTN|nr:hypothetical protein [Streptomyces gardneri]GEB62111.1 hypothetical protein SGA01_77160 [Streptomyces gardneri]GHH23448.1 hypothetical protein GCM10017674_80040 [Streptomyces gardneri]
MGGKIYPTTDTSEARVEWNLELRVLVIRAKGAANLLPQSQDRRRIRARNAMDLIREWDGQTLCTDYSAATHLLIGEAMEQLGTFLQGEKEPPERDIRAVVREELERLHRNRLINRLRELEREGEEHGLDPEEIEEANQLQSELGVQHTRELD